MAIFRLRHGRLLGAARGVRRFGAENDGNRGGVPEHSWCRIGASNTTGNRPFRRHSNASWTGSTRMQVHSWYTRRMAIDEGPRRGGDRRERLLEAAEAVLEKGFAA